MRAPVGQPGHLAIVGDPDAAQMHLVHVHSSSQRKADDDPCALGLGEVVVVDVEGRRLASPRAVTAAPALR